MRYAVVRCAPVDRNLPPASLAAITDLGSTWSDRSDGKRIG
jgi:hypothetical protein